MSKQIIQRIEGSESIEFVDDQYKFLFKCDFIHIGNCTKVKGTIDVWCYCNVPETAMDMARDRLYSSLNAKAGNIILISAELIDSKE